jgi:hypothetical protein
MDITSPEERTTSALGEFVSMNDQHKAQLDVIEALREEFRSHLETFYAKLKLAPPYESVEKAIRTLVTAVQALSKDERTRIAENSTLKWDLFQQAFERSGLSRKHRGIIAGLANNRASVDLPAEYDRFLSLFRP